MLGISIKAAVLAAFVIAPVAVARAADDYGALSYSRTRGIYSVALDRPSRADAEREALAKCRQSSQDCLSPVWVQNGCVALAIGHKLGYGTGWGSTRASAEDEAMGVCGSHTAACTIRHTACTRGH